MAAISQTQVRPGAATVRTPLFVVGIALALFAFIAMFAVGVIFARGTQGVGQVRVVVAAQDIGAREPITLDMVTLGTVAGNAVPPKALTRLSDMTSLSALVTIYKGEVISANLVASNPDSLTAGAASSYIQLPSGYVAVTIPSGEQQAVSGFIAQGDYINVIATVDVSQFAANRHGSVTRTIFTEVLILRVGPQSAVPRQGQPQGVASSLVVMMTQCDADYMTWLLANATVKYTLLSFHDYDLTVPPADPSCPSNKLSSAVTAAAVDGRWGFTKA